MKEEPIETIDYKGYKIKIFYDTDATSPDDWGDEEVFLVYDHRQFNVKREGFEPRDIFEYLQIKNNCTDLKQTLSKLEVSRDELYKETGKTLSERALTDLEIIQISSRQSKINSTIEHSENKIEELEELEDDLKGYFDYESEYYIFPVNAYIHSGVSLSLNNSYPHNCPWDTSTTGYVLVKKYFKDCNDTIPVSEESALSQASYLISTWNKFLSGQVYLYEIIGEEEFYKVSKSDWDNGELILDQIEDCAIITEEISLDCCSGYYDKDLAIEDAKDCIDNY